MAKEFPIITTNRLLLKQFTKIDMENVFRGLSHPDVIKYYGISFDTLDKTKEQMVWFSDLEKNETGIWWAICSKENNCFIGACGLNDLIKEHKKAEIGFWLLPDYWRNGFTKEAIPLIIDFGFRNLGLHRIEGFVDTRNVSCKKLLTGLGFEHEGTMRDCEIKDGKLISLDIFSILSDR